VEKWDILQRAVYDVRVPQVLQVSVVYWVHACAAAEAADH
jgi:hypothetical protein